MRPLVLLLLAAAPAAGCRHAAQLMTQPAAEAAGPEAPCPPPGEAGAEQPEAVGPNPGCAPGAPAPCDQAAPPCGPAPGGRRVCRQPEIHVTVPPPKVIIRREEKAPPPPAAPPPPRPGNEVMLVPTTVYVPYARMTPTGPATMLPLQMAPGVPPPAAAPPCAPPAAPPAAPPPCAPPAAPPYAPGSPTCSPPGAPAPAQTLDSLNRRCTELESKIDALIEAINRSRLNK